MIRSLQLESVALPIPPHLHTHSHIHSRAVNGGGGVLSYHLGSALPPRTQPKTHTINKRCAVTRCRRSVIWPLPVIGVWVTHTNTHTQSYVKLPHNKCARCSLAQSLSRSAVRSRFVPSTNILRHPYTHTHTLAGRDVVSDIVKQKQKLKLRQANVENRNQQKPLVVF